MIIQLSDYMLEQAVSDAEVSDIALEQALAEKEVTFALANAYYKQVLMQEYSLGDVYTEADDTTEKKESKIGKFFRTIWEAIVKAFRWIGDQFKKFFNWIAGLFSKDKKLHDKLKDVVVNGSEHEVNTAYDEAVKYLESKKDKIWIGAVSEGSLLSTVYDTNHLKEKLARCVDSYDDITGKISSIIGDIDSSNFDSMTKNIKSCVEDIKKFLKSIGYTKSDVKDMGAEHSYNLSSTNEHLSNIQTSEKIGKKREALKKMLEYMEYIGGEGRPTLNKLQDKMNQFDTKVTHLLEYVKKVESSGIDTDKLSAEKKTELISALKEFGTTVDNWSKMMYKFITGHHEACTAIRDAVMAVAKADKRHDEVNASKNARKAIHAKEGKEPTAEEVRDLVAKYREKQKDKYNNLSISGRNEWDKKMEKRAREILRSGRTVGDVDESEFDVG